MARIRTIKPEFFTNSKIMRLAPLARLFYVSLWCEADRLGRLKWDADSLKARYLPSDKANADELGTILADAKLIRFYDVDGQLYADIPGFTEHQVINNREAESKIPPYTDHACVTRESGDTHAAYGKEGRKGREGTTPIVPKGTTNVPEDFARFWEAYPNKTGKDAALKAWLKRKRDMPDISTVIAAVNLYIKTKPSDRDWCNPSTWINQGRWQDQPLSAAIHSQSPHQNEDAIWRARVSGWGKMKFWNRDLWGPPPDEPGCKVPYELIPRKTA